MKAEGWTAVAAWVVGFAGIAGVVWNGCETRNHNRLSARPCLSTWVTPAESLSFDRFVGLRMRNVGYGIAVVEPYEIWVDGERVPGKEFDKWEEAIRRLGLAQGEIDWITFSVIKGGHMVLGVGEEQQLFGISPAFVTIERNNRMIELLKSDRLVLSTRYCSMYDECWTYHSRATESECTN